MNLDRNMVDSSKVEIVIPDAEQPAGGTSPQDNAPPDFGGGGDQKPGDKPAPESNPADDLEKAFKK